MLSKSILKLRKVKRFNKSSLPSLKVSFGLKELLVKGVIFKQKRINPSLGKNTRIRA